MANVARKDAKRFSSLNVSTTYKGVRPESKGAGNKAGFQSLGKIGKRMPGPAQLPSLRKENAGNDPTVNLVPTGGGWGAGKEDEQQDTNKESTTIASSQPVPQQDAQHQTSNQQPPVDNTSIKKETIWATEMNNLGPSHPAPSQHFQKNFPSLEEREAHSTKRTDNSDTLHYDNEVENVTGAPAPPPGPYQYGPRGPRPPYSMPPHMAPPYLSRGMGPFRHGMPPPPPAEFNQYGGHPGAGSFRGYPPQQHPAPPPNAAGHYYMPGYMPPHGPPPPGVNVGHNMDPYQEGQSKLVKSEELKNLELPEEDDDVGGWAGYHEEVDYSKKVVFDDSSDDEDRPNHQPQSIQAKRKESLEPGDIKAEALPVTEPQQLRQQPHPHPEHPKHFYPPPHGDGHYYRGMPPQRYSYYPPGPRGYPVVVATRPVEKERMGPHPPPDIPWQQGRRGTKGVPPTEAAWREDRMITPSLSTSSQAAVQAPDDIELSNQVEQLNDTESPNTALAADKKHVTFHIEQQQQPAVRRQPIKVMMRDMKSGTRDDNEQPPTDALHHGSMGKPPYHPRPSDSDTQIINDKQLPPQRVSAWKAADRGPITTTRTLYEPEGDKSAKKFNALIKQTASDRAKRSSVSDTVQDEQIPSPSGDIKILKSDDKQAKGKQQQSSAPPTNGETNKETVDQKPQQSSGKTKHDSSSSRKGSKRDRPAVRQYQPPAARNQDEQVYSSENRAGGSRRPPRYQEYNLEGRYQRRKDSGQHFEGKHHLEGKHQHKTGGKHPSQAEEKQFEGKNQSHPEGKRHSYSEDAHSEGKHLDGKRQSYPEGKHYSYSEGKYLDIKHQEGKQPDSKHQSQAEGKHQKQHHSEGRHFDSRRERPKRDKDTKDLLPSQEEPHPQEDAEKSKQSGKEPHNKTAGETKQQKKKSNSSGQKETTGAKARSSRGRNRNDDWGYYNDDYYNDYQWYGSNYDYYNYGDYDYDYDYQREYYPEHRRGPSGRSRQQQQSTSSTSEKKDSTNRRSQQSTTTGRPPRTRKDESRKDEPSDGVDKTQQHKGNKSNDEDKPLPEGGADNRRRRTDSRQQQQQDNDKRRFAKSGSSGGKGPAGRGTGANKTSPSNSSLDQRPVEDPQQKTTTKKDAAVKEKAPARMVNVDINSPNVVVIDEDVATPLSPNSASEVDDFIRVTSKKEKREMKEQEKHRQQEKQRKAEEEENKKKHSSKKSHKSKHQQQHSSHEQTSQQGEAQPALSNSWTTATTITTQSSSIWSDSYTNLLSEGVHHPNYMTTSLIRPQGDYQLFPTSFTTPTAVPLAHLSAAVDSSVAQELPSSASQTHTLSETEKVASVERQDPVSSGRGVRTDLPVSKSHSSMSVGGTIGRGRGSSNRAPGSNRAVSSSNKDKRLPTSSSDTKLSSSTTPVTHKMSKPGTAVRSKPTPTAANTINKVSEVSTTPAPAAVVTTRRGSTTPSQVQASGGGKRAGRQQHTGYGSKTNKQSTNVPANSYAGVVKSSPVYYDQHGIVPTAVKPVAYVRPTPSNGTDSEQVVNVITSLPDQFPTADVSRDVVAPVAGDYPVTSDHHVTEKVTFVSAATIVMTTTVTTTTTVKPFTFVASHTKNVTNSNSSSAVTITTTSVKRSPIREDNTRDGIEVATKKIRLGSSVQSTTLEFATKLNIAAVPFVPSSSIQSGSHTSILATPSVIATPSIVTTPKATLPVEAKPSIVPSQSVAATPPINAMQSALTVPSLAATPSRQSMVTTAMPSSVPAKSIVAIPVGAVPTQSIVATPMAARQSMITATPSFVPVQSMVATPLARQLMMTAATPSVGKQSIVTTSVAATPSLLPAQSKVATPSVIAAPSLVATPPHKHPAVITGYQFPSGTIVPAPTIVPVFVPHTHMAAAATGGGGFAISQPAPYQFPAVPSHAYHIDATHHPHSIMGLAYSGGVPMQPHPQAAANNSYRLLVPAAPFSQQQPAPQKDYHQQQRKKEQDPKRYSDQNVIPPQVYKFPTVPLPVPSSEGRRTLLENPAVMPAPLPLDTTTLTGSKRKRRGPLMPLPQQLPAAPAPARNVTMKTLW